MEKFFTDEIRSLMLKAFDRAKSSRFWATLLSSGYAINADSLGDWPKAAIIATAILAYIASETYLKARAPKP